MKTIFKKLKSKVGESLVESLAAILIFTMASVVLYSMVTTAGDINGKAKEMDAANQQHLLAVERGEPAEKNGTGTIAISMTAGNGTTVSLTEGDPIVVDIYGGQEEGSLYTYFVQPAPPAGG